MTTEHSWSEYAASYALGALDDAERDQFEAHLGQCVSCRADVHAYQEVTGSIALAVPPSSPPGDLRARILEQARQARPTAGARAAPVAQPLWIPWTLAAACLAVALGLGALYARERTGRIAAELSTSAAEGEVAALRTEMAGTDSLIEALLGPGVESARLVSAGRPPSARLFYNRAQNVVVVAAYDLPPAPAGRTYQLWGIAGGQPTSLGTFNTGADGRAIARLAVSNGVRFTVGAVTEEPAGGSPQPTTPPFLTGSWAQ